MQAKSLSIMCFLSLKLAIGFVLILSSSSCQQAEQASGASHPTNEESKVYLQEFETVLYDDILHKWFPASLDTVEGGYFSNFKFDWSLSEGQSKMIVTQGRLLWTSSHAAMFDREDKRYIVAAQHGFTWLANSMWDSEYGGFFQLVNRSGNLMDEGDILDEKRAYGQAFAIYGLAAYYKLSQQAEVLELAQKGFKWLETHSHDKTYGGYFDYLTRSGERYRTGYELDNSTERAALKDYNSSIHLLEAFAELFEVWQDSLLEERLKEMLYIVRDTITQEAGYMHLYFFPDWQELSYRDSTAEVREAYYGADHVSPGHDAETAFLLLEAAEILDEYGSSTETHYYEETLPTAKKLLDHSLAYGWDQEMGGFIEQGYYMKGEQEMTVIDNRKNWWGQVEGLHSLLLFSNLYPGEVKYWNAFKKQWEYMEANLLDPEHGGWYSWGIDLVPEVKYAAKGHNWKGPYHTGRGMMRCVALLRDM